MSHAVSSPIPLNLSHTHPLRFRTASLPVRYVFPKRSLDISTVASELYTTAFPTGTADFDETLAEGILPEDREARGRKGVVVFWDVGYDWIEGTSPSSQRTPLAHDPC